MHLHKEKDEVFYLQSGKVLLEIEHESYTMMPGDYAHIPPGTKHRFTGLEDSEIMEFSTEHREEDSFRHELSGHAEPERYARQSALLQNFSQQNILVIGDIMLDAYTEGSVERISPEAPVPVLSSCTRRFVPGGAGNVAANICALGGSVRVLSVCGGDSAAQQLRDLCAAHHIAVHFVTDQSRRTTVKERIVDTRARQQIVRIDTEDTQPICEEIERQLLALLSAQQTVSSSGAILLSDYAKGVLTPRLFEHIYTLAERHEIPVLVDPKPHGSDYLSHLKRAAIVTPNTSEAQQLAGAGVDTPFLGQVVSQQVSGSVLWTRGAKGVDVCRQGETRFHADSVACDVVDVSGAGDTVVSVSALCLAAGASIEDTADMANRAAGVVVGKHGTATLTPEELDAVL